MESHIMTHYLIGMGCITLKYVLRYTSFVKNLSTKSIGSNLALAIEVITCLQGIALICHSPYVYLLGALKSTK